MDVVVVNAAGQLAAYVNECAHQGLPLDNALIDAKEGTLTCPWHGFCYDSATGECMSMPGAQLQQLPLRIEDGRVWVRAGRRPDEGADHCHRFDPQRGRPRLWRARHCRFAAVVVRRLAAPRDPRR